MNKKPELLAPAGSLEKLKWAVDYGADAIYIGGTKYSLRANAKNFTLDDMVEGVKYAHSKNVKLYVTINIVFHDEDEEGLIEYLKELESIGVDAIIFSDPIVLDFAKKSGCYNVTLNVWSCNESAMKFYEKCGLVPQKVGMEVLL